MMFIFLLQLRLPLLFIAWLALAPLKSKLGFFVQLFGIAAALVEPDLTL